MRIANEHCQEIIPPRAWERFRGFFVFSPTHSGMRIRPNPLFFFIMAFLSLFYCISDSFFSMDALAQEKSAAIKPMASPAKNKTVIDMTAEELRQSYSSVLREVEFVQSQDELNPLLAKIGERVETFFRDFSNTSSKEEVLLQRLGYADRLESSMERTFYYLILFNPNDNHPLLQEYRTDKTFRAIDQNGITGFFITSGYGCLSVLFHPKYIQDSTFRYLGRQSSGSCSHIIAFAQKSGIGSNLVKFTDTDQDKSIRVPLQGIVWVDPSTYQILRMRTSLVPAENPSFIATQTTDIQFSEIRFNGVPQQFWLPREVNVNMRISGKTYRNLHRYSEYRLFSTDTDVKFAQPKPAK